MLVEELGLGIEVVEQVLAQSNPHRGPADDAARPRELADELSELVGVERESVHVPAHRARQRASERREGEREDFLPYPPDK